MQGRACSNLEADALFVASGEYAGRDWSYLKTWTTIQGKKLYI